MTTRIAVPADKVRTREVILAEPHVLLFEGRVWLPCYHCGGSGNYPSSMIPAGRCRLYCWALRDAFGGAKSRLGTEWAPTFGRLAKDVEKYVKAQQASDRRAYREAVKWEQERPAREAAAEARRIEQEQRAAEKAAREAAILAEKQARKHLGAVGERLTLTMTVSRVSSFQQAAYGAPWKQETRYIVSLRDADKNLAVWFTGSPAGFEEGATVTFKATVKKHQTYKDEPQTLLTRCKLALDSQS